MSQWPDRHQTVHAGAWREKIDSTLARIAREEIVGRLWKRDPTVWKSEPEHQSIIRNALGWLDVVALLHSKVNELQAFADGLRGDFDDVVVLGMGGSSLCAEVMSRSFGREKGFPRLRVLDSTVPAAVRALDRELNPARSLFIVASKSGTTTEPRMFQRYFFDRVRSVRGARAAESFIAITDPDTALEHEAASDGFRRVFLNPPDIGGRYSALSWFGMVPAALAGIDVFTLLDRALEAVHACMNDDPWKNPGAMLGATLGTLAQSGRDKLTLRASSPVDSVGLWIEQLIAESTGKEGRGILPIAGEPSSEPGRYADDRLFVSIAVDGREDGELDALRRAGHPVVEHRLRDVLDLGAEFFVWEIATAVAGSLLGIDPFDQPNVQESKDNTKRLLAEFQKKGSLPEQPLLAEDDSLRVYGDERWHGGTPADVIGALLDSVDRHDYIAFTQYIRESAEHENLLQEMRHLLLENKGVATTTGYGPRFLHSTGQLHKGGPPSGVFIQITGSGGEDLPIPGESLSFGTLASAQALGDFQSLASRDRRAIRVELGDDDTAGLRALRSVIRDRVEQARS